MTASAPTAHPTGDTPDIPAPPGATKSFTDFGVDADLAAALTDAGITSPFPIQELTLPLALNGADVIGQARTGTGKTLAFGLPMLQRLDMARTDTQVLVVVPTRELCLQVRDDLDKAGTYKGVRVVAAYGGRPIEPQAEAIAAGAPVVVGTPGRLLDLMRRGQLNLSTVTGLVIDEADEMLDLGFLPDVEQLIEATAPGRHTLLFSATMPSAVVGLARRYMRKPTFLRADVEEVRIPPETTQYFFSCHRMDKPAVLARILQTPKRGLCVVFTRTKRMADMLTEELRERDVDASPIHSDLRQEARERALSRFRQGKVDVLVATEVAARGLDIDDVTHVVNYDCPDDEKMYLHRVGRTGRAGATGVAITLAVWNELARLEMIKRALEVEAETFEVFSTSEILDELFDLPPRDARPHRSPPRSEAPARTDSPRRRDAKGSRGGETTPGRETAAKAAPREAAATQEADEAGPTRRRVRRRSSGDAAPTPATTAPRKAAMTASEPANTTRTRTRTRRRISGDEPRPQRGQSRGRSARGPRVAPAEASQAVEPNPPVDASSAPSPERNDRGSTRQTARGAQRRDVTRSRGDGRGRERTPPAGNRERTPKRGRSPSPIDSDTARAGGKPRLRRPLVIEHLP